MKRITSLAYAAVLLSSYAAQANVSLEMPSYFSVLAAQSQEMKKLKSRLI